MGGKAPRKILVTKEAKKQAMSSNTAASKARAAFVKPSLVSPSDKRKKKSDAVKARKEPQNVARKAAAAQGESPSVKAKGGKE
ncbi:hypothetical protein FRC11_007887 [Ceratobasidium sp. 423]|nr:hypothetical protein FRC11_007887 [Ceratobasidium sp. 423]